jgi:hypothetical protein
LGGSVPSKSREKFGEVRIPNNFGQARPSKSQENTGKSAFRECFGSPKNCGKLRENPDFETCSSQENSEEFLDKPILQNPETPRKNPRFQIFLGPLKNCGKLWENLNFETCTLWKNCKESEFQNLFREIFQLANPPIFL